MSTTANALYETRYLLASLRTLKDRKKFSVHTAMWADNIMTFEIKIDEQVVIKTVKLSYPSRGWEWGRSMTDEDKEVKEALDAVSKELDLCRARGMNHSNINYRTEYGSKEQPH